MITLTQLKKVKNYEDLENLGIGRIAGDISYRGGTLGFYGSDISKVFDIYDYLLPHKFGAYCNYLGGGLRGGVFASDFSHEITGKKARLLEELGKACVRVYYDIDRAEVEDDVMEGVARVNGVKSAY